MRAAVRRKKKFLTSFLLLLLLLIGALFLTYKFVVPALIEYALEERLEEGLKKEVHLGRVDFNLFRGVEFQHLLICEPGREEKVFLQAEEFKIGYLIGDVLDNLRKKGKNFREWQLTLEAGSPEIIFRGWRLENLEFPLRLENSQLIGEGLKTELYGGTLKGSFSLNLSSGPKDYRFQGALSGFDLSRLGERVNSSKKKKFKGILAASLNVKGTVGDLKELSGQGEVSIVEGKLWEFPLLGGLMAILHVPSLEKVTFREGKANFTISEGMVATEDLTLNSDKVKISAEGKVDFQGYFRPSLTYRISFSKGFVEDVPLVGDIISFIIDEAGYLIAQVEVTGSLKNPKPQLIPLAKGLRNIFRIFKRRPGLRRKS